MFSVYQRISYRVSIWAFWFSLRFSPWAIRVHDISWNHETHASPFHIGFEWKQRFSKRQLRWKVDLQFKPDFERDRTLLVLVYYGHVLIPWVFEVAKSHTMVSIPTCLDEKALRATVGNAVYLHQRTETGETMVSLTETDLWFRVFRQGHAAVSSLLVAKHPFAKQLRSGRPLSFLDNRNVAKYKKSTDAIGTNQTRIVFYSNNTWSFVTDDSFDLVNERNNDPLQTNNKDDSKHTKTESESEKQKAQGSVSKIGR